jgi:23S rRNA (cytidine1920-2'-O)/16S rRNA (cytidine1409-2'-O)-methyltransferase
VARRVRLDAELVRRGLARSRQEAAALIGAGRVLLDASTVSKPATQMDPAQALVVTDVVDEPRYASRGGFKLAGALDALGDAGPVVAGRRALDAGASTGGFTDVLLRRGAEHVVAVDVGYGQLVWGLQQDPRVTVRDRTNVRALRPDDVGPPPGLVVADLSFISLTLVLPALVAVAAPDADFLLMVKPQFEVGRERLGAGGVVREPALRAWAVREVSDAALSLGLRTLAVVPSPLPGPSGNVEYFIWLRRPDSVDPADTGHLDAMIATAIESGPPGPGGTDL